MLCLSTNKGEMFVLDKNLATLFKISSIAANKLFKSTSGIGVSEPPRQMMIKLVHPQKSQNEGDFLIITDGEEINVNVWCKPLN